MEKLQENILDISHNHYQYLLNLKNVSGVGLSYKKINNINTFEPCINVLVKEKVNEKYISSDNIIPKSYMGIKTDVSEVGKIKPCSNDHLIIKERLRPLQGGGGIEMVTNGEAGTLGCIVKKIIKDTPRYYILTNNHVIAGDNDIPLGDAVMQPTKEFGGKYAKDIIAILSTFVPLKFKKGDEEPPNYIDAAIAKILRKELISNSIYKVGKITGVNNTVNIGDKIKKVGFTTGLTEGEIESLGVTMIVPYNEYGTKDALFKNQITANLILDSGDSGAIVLNESNEAIGLLFAGGEDYSCINKISTVLRALKAEIFID